MSAIPILNGNNLKTVFLFFLPHRRVTNRNSRSMEKVNVSSPEFLNQLRQRDSQAVSYLVEKYSKTLMKAALTHKISADEAEEVVQDTWADFFAQVEKFEGRSHVRTYLIGILYNKIKTHLRQAKKTVHADEIDYEEKLFQDGLWKNEPRDPENILNTRNGISQLQEALDRLPENQKMALYLKEVQGESSESICEIMNISKTNLGVLIYRAKNFLRTEIYQDLAVS
ncbi:MAG: sigma-70 family RNA polymerase sigma factor, partial [Pseudomonadota bacterium]